jgi:hypothetical protein
MGVIQPEDDNTPAPGTHCFITGNAPPGSGVAVNDVDGGITTLLSPVLNLSAAQDPHIALYYWYTNDGGQAPGLDSFVIRISGNGGTNWVTVFSTTESNHAWEYLEFRVGDFVAPTANMRVSFLAQDLDAGSVVEAGVDDFGWFSVQEQSAAPEGPVIQRPVSAAPNPFASSTVLRLSLPAPGALSVQVFDTAGRLVRKLYSGSATGAIEVPWDGRDDSGSEAPGGVYFVRSSGKGFDHVTRVVRVR